MSEQQAMASSCMAQEVNTTTKRLQEIIYRQELNLAALWSVPDCRTILRVKLIAKEFGARHRCGAKFADDDAAGAVGGHDGVGHRHAGP